VQAREVATVINGGGNGNEAGQAQGNSFNVAVVTQTGGTNNLATQNQGITGYYHVAGGHVVH
jgi:hypothetical protein